MPCGLKDALLTFLQRAVVIVLASDKWQLVLVCLDSLVILSQTLRPQINHKWFFFGLFKEDSVTLKFRK